MKGLGLGLDKLKSKSSGEAVVNPFLNANLIFSIYDLGFGNIPVIRVRRTGGATPAEADFTATEISDGTLTTWVGVGNNGFIPIFYNHNGTNDAFQISAASQYQIVNNGNLIFQNGIAVVDTLDNPGYNLDVDVNISAIYFVSKIDSYKTINYIAGNESPSQGFFNGGIFGGINGLGVFESGTIYTDTNENLDFQITYHEIDSSNNIIVQKNNLAEVNIGTSILSSLLIERVFGRNAAALTLSGKFASFVAFDSDTVAIKNSIITELNSITPIY